MILIYAFSNQWGTNISRRTLLELQKLLNRNTIIPPLVKEGVGGDFVFQIIHFHPRSFFDKYIKNNAYDLIIGLGDYFGQITKIKIETAARNIYGRQSIYPFAPVRLELSLPVLDLFDPAAFTVSENMGTYNCNWIAFQTQIFLNRSSSDTKQLFFHLPKSQNASLLARRLFELLTNNNLI